MIWISRYIPPEALYDDLPGYTTLKNVYTDGTLMIGLGSGMPEASACRKACSNGPCSPQICLLSSRIDVSLLRRHTSNGSIVLTFDRPDIFDEYTRRQYIAKAPARNPFGDEEEPLKFNDFDVFTKIRVLQQLSTWTLGNASRIRELMPNDEDQLNWRMEPLGWDKEDRAYFVLDDNRLYRRTDEPPPLPTPKIKPKKKAPAPKKPKSRGTRASKRRKIEETSEEEVEEPDAGEQEDTVMTNGDHTVVEEEDAGYGFTNKTWECVAITLEEYSDFLATIFRSRDPNEKSLRKRMEEGVLPIIEKRNEALRAKQMKKLRELENLQKMASAKRSGRLAEKAEKERQEREEREVEEKKLADLRMAHEEQERQRRIEEGHESRRLTREQRLKDREVKRILHEEELAKLEEDTQRASSQDPNSDAATEGKRISERQIKTQKAQHKKELEKLAEDDDKWYFDCSVCGMHGENLDDGSHSVACERCDVWQHSKCHNFSPKQVEKDGFHFVCVPCKRKEEDAKKPKIPTLKLKKKESASPDAQRTADRPPSSAANGRVLPDHIARQLDGNYYPPPHHSAPPPAPYGQLANGPSLSPFGQGQGPPGYRYPPVGNFAPHPHQVPPPQQPWGGSPLLQPPRPGSSGYAQSSPPAMTNGYGSPPQHRYQHQNMHHDAMAASGGHPRQHAPPYQEQGSLNGYSPRAPGGLYPSTHMPPQQLPHYQQQNFYNQQAPPQRPGSSHLLKGFQSPTKGAVKPSSSPQQPHQSPYNPSVPQQLHQQRPSYSPNPHFAPNTHQPNGQSPARPSVSPNIPQQQAAPYHRPLAPSPIPQTTQQPYPGQIFRRPSANGIPPQFQTPQQAPQRVLAHQGNPSPAGANSNHVAADGMSGPWPEGSKAIPQKHDRSPAPPPPPFGQSPQPIYSNPASATQPAHRPPTASPLERRLSQGMQTLPDVKAAAPAVSMPPVALSPSQQQVQQAQMTGPASVPVKKMLVDNPQSNETAHQDGSTEARALRTGADGTNSASEAAKLQAAAQLAANVLTEKKSEINGTSDSKIEQAQTEGQTLQPAQPGASVAQT